MEQLIEAALEHARQLRQGPTRRTITARVPRSKKPGDGSEWLEQRRMN